MPNPAAAALLARSTAFAAALAAWYRREARRLPWRDALLLLQDGRQRIHAAADPGEDGAALLRPVDFEALPDFAALAAAPEDDVLKLWEGLGYYSRARNLRRLAQALAARPEIPRRPEAWEELPGIGPYTAAAVTSIAFGAAAACVDGNVVRILARLTADGREYPG